MAIAAYLDAKDKNEEVEVDEGMKYTHVAVDKKGLVIGFASDEKDAKDMAKRNDGKVVKLKKPMSDKKGDMMVNRPFKEEDEKKMDKPDSAKMVDQGREDKKKTRIAQLQLQIAKAQETINKLNAQESPMGKYLKTKEGSIESAVLEAMNPAQQAAIAISKRKKQENWLR